MPLTDTVIRNAKPKNKPYKMADAGACLFCFNLLGERVQPGFLG